MEENEEKYGPMQRLKRAMYAMRNGVVADTLRKGGSPFKVIFGVNLPQLVEIAAAMGQDHDFACEVWENSTTRESMLIAPMLMPAAEFTEAEARRWVAEVPAPEVADVLCLKLLRHTPYALPLALELIDSQDVMAKYTGLRLMCNLAPKHQQQAAAIGIKLMPTAEGILRQPISVLASYAED